jgi:predicted transcriptional regulator
MKTATIPSLRVAPELRLSAQNVLREGETLSSFVEQAIRSTVEYRQAEQEFINRGLASRDSAKHSGRYISADAVIGRLEALLGKAKSSAKTPL